MKLEKPKHLSAGDMIATVSVSNGWAGDPDIFWKYELGKKRLEDIFELNVQAAPNSMRGHEYLKSNPKARADDLMWAFENKTIKAIIANIGGNDSIQIIPFIDPAVIKNNPKIFIGFSDAINVHLLCYKAGLSTSYGHNLLSTIAADTQNFHPYSEKWFKNTLFDVSPIGTIEPSDSWTFDEPNYLEKNFKRNYYPNPGYKLIQGNGIVRGKLFGGFGLSEFENSSIAFVDDDFENSILFIEDIPIFFTPKLIEEFFRKLGEKGFLKKMRGIIIGKIRKNISFDEHGHFIKNVISDELGLKDLPVLYGLNFGHSSPQFILPYGAQAEINCEAMSFSILESGVA